MYIYIYIYKVYLVGKYVLGKARNTRTLMINEAGFKTDSCMTLTAMHVQWWTSIQRFGLSFALSKVLVSYDSTNKLL
jgi:hypothetical protein